MFQLLSDISLCSTSSSVCVSYKRQIPKVIFSKGVTTFDVTSCVCVAYTSFINCIVSENNQQNRMKKSSRYRSMTSNMETK